MTTAIKQLPSSAVQVCNVFWKLLRALFFPLSVIFSLTAYIIYAHNTIVKYSLVNKANFFCLSGVELFNQIKNGVICFEISESVLYSREVKQLYCERKSFVHNHSDMINMVFGDYRLVKFIGKGELGIVYLAQHQENGGFAACKILRPELQTSGSAIQKFVCEAKTAAKFDHSNIIKAIGYGVEEGYHYFLMEYVDGSSLEYLRLNNPEMLSIEFLCSRFAELADALDYVL